MGSEMLCPRSLVLSEGEESDPVGVLRIFVGRGFSRAESVLFSGRL